MSDKLAQAEAWIRKKPKRTIHNQKLIQVLLMLSVGVPIPLAGVVIALAFCVPYMPLMLLVAWCIASSSYITLRVVVAKRNRSAA